MLIAINLTCLSLACIFFVLWTREADSREETTESLKNLMVRYNQLYNKFQIEKTLREAEAIINKNLQEEK